MKKFVFLSYGFEPPTPEIMQAWGAWFESIKGQVVEMGGFGAGREISKAGVKPLPMAVDSLTGFVIVKAESLDEAETMAARNPYIASIRVYEIRG